MSVGIMVRSVDGHNTSGGLRPFDQTYLQRTPVRGTGRSGRPVVATACREGFV